MSEAIHPAETLPGPGDRIGDKYRLDRKLGEGGVGVVYLAENVILEQRVVIKMLRGGSGIEGSDARFLREARAAAKIENEHVARVLDFGTVPGSGQAPAIPYLVMEFLDGHDLSEELAKQGALPIADVVRYVLELLDGLAAAHDAGIVHRDLKPANLFLAKRSGGRAATIKLLDFGIAKQLGPAEASHALTSTGAVMGSPYYMSPEQFRSTKYVEARSDLWAVGVILYELVTGGIPFPGEGIGDVIAAVMHDAPRPPRELRPDLPPGLEAIILSCLEKDREKRPASARDLARSLARFSEGTASELPPLGATLGQAAPSSPSSPLAPSPAHTQSIDGLTRASAVPGRRAPLIAIGAGAFVVVAAIAGGAALHLGDRGKSGPTEPPTAIIEPSLGAAPITPPPTLPPSLPEEVSVAATDSASAFTPPTPPSAESHGVSVAGKPKPPRARPVTPPPSATAVAAPTPTAKDFEGQK